MTWYELVILVIAGPPAAVILLFCMWHAFLGYIVAGIIVFWLALARNAMGLLNRPKTAEKIQHCIDWVDREVMP